MYLNIILDVFMAVVIIAVVVDFLDYKSSYSIRAENIKDLAGNYINENNSAWFDFDGYNPNEQQPYLIIK